ncbi:hypothetical protein Pelo_3837 [Pelomyxa schiedti]|nr:hypothetical protein Pelo_3837 [Pelomyxa schiedti]
MAAVTFEFNGITHAPCEGETVLVLVRLPVSWSVWKQILWRRRHPARCRLYSLPQYDREHNCFSGRHSLFPDTYWVQFAIYHRDNGFLWKGPEQKVVVPTKTNVVGVFGPSVTTSNSTDEMEGSFNGPNEVEAEAPEETGIPTSMVDTACNRTFFFSGYLNGWFTTLSDISLRWRFGEILVEEIAYVGLTADVTEYKLDSFYITTKASGIWDFQSISEQETSQWLKKFKELKKPVFDPRVTASDAAVERRRVEIHYDEEAEKKVSLEAMIENFAQTKSELSAIHSVTHDTCNSGPKYLWPAASVAILGDMKAGKSTLCNAILGNITLPSRRLRCTSRVTIIKAGAAREYVIQNSGGVITEGPIPFTGELPPTAVALPSDQRLKGASLIVEVHLPVEPGARLPVPGFDFVDLPGLGESKALDAIVMNALKKVVGVIYILDVTSGAVKQQDVDAIQTLLKSGIHKSVPILFVGNKVDRLDNEEEENQESPKTVLDAFYADLKALVPDLLARHPDRETSPYWAELSALKCLAIRRGKTVKNQQKHKELFDSFGRRLQGLIGRTLNTTILGGCEEICGPCGMYADTIISFGEVQHGISTCRSFVEQLKGKEEEIIRQCSALVQQATRDTLDDMNVIAKDAVTQANKHKYILISWRQAMEESTEHAFNQHLWATLKPKWRQFVAHFFKPLSRHLHLVNNNVVDSISCDESRIPLWQIVIPLALYVGIAVIPLTNAIREAACTYDNEWKESYSKECLKCINPAKEGNRVAKELARKLIENAGILVKAKADQLAAIMEGCNPAQTIGTDALTVLASSKLLGLASANGFVHGIPELKAQVCSDFYGDTFEAVWRGVPVHAKRLHKFSPETGPSVLKSILTQLCTSRIDMHPSFGIVKNHSDGNIFVICSPEISPQLQSPSLEAIMNDVGLNDAVVLPPLGNILQSVSMVSLDEALRGLHPTIGCTEECLTNAIVLCRTKVIDEGLVTRACGNGSFVGEPLTTEEAAAIVLYTRDSPQVFAAMNLALRNPHRTSASLEQWKPYTKLLLTALTKLKPVIDTTAYRGYGTLPESWQTKFSPHRETKICWYGFSSISRSRVIAAEFAAMQGQRGLLLEVRAPLAYDITGFSWFGLTEAELLTPPGCNFTPLSLDDSSPKYVSATIQFHSYSSLLYE